jgi:hypothetical protein
MTAGKFEEKIENTSLTLGHVTFHEMRLLDYF